MAAKKAYPNVRKNGEKWGYRFHVTRSGKRERISKSGFDTPLEAFRAYEEAFAPYRDNPEHVGPGKRTYGDWLLSDWLPRVDKLKRRTTAAGYRHFAEKFVIPALGDVQLGKLTTLSIERLYLGAQRLDGKGPLAPASVHQLRAVVHRSLAEAVKSGLLVRNPAEGIEIPTRDDEEEPELRVWTQDEARAFFTYMDGLEPRERDPFAAIFELTFMTGLRRGEVLGLKWKADVDLDVGTITVRRVRTVVNHAVIEKAPKTQRSKRVIAVDPHTVAMLKAHRTRQLELQMKNREYWIDDDYVFTDGMGQPIHPTTCAQTFRRRVLKAGVPMLTMHGLRHAHASALLDQGESVPTVAQRLGHRDTSLIHTTYGHPIEGRDQLAAQRLGERMAR